MKKVIVFFIFSGFVFCEDFLKISGNYNAIYSFEKDRRDKSFHLSNFPPLMKLYSWEGDNTLSSWLDVWPLSPSEPSHNINFNFSLKTKSINSFFSFSMDSSNDLVYNERPIYLNRATFDYRRGFLKTLFFLKTSPSPFDDPMGLFKPGGVQRFLFEESPMRTYEWPLGWDGKDCQGLEVDFEKKDLSLRVLGIDRYSQYYVNYDGTKEFADSYFVAGRIKRGTQKKVGFTYIRKSWRSDRAVATHEESAWNAGIDGSFPLSDGVSLMPQIAQTFANYVSRNDLVFDKGFAWMIKIKAQKQNADFEISYRSIGERFSPLLARFYSDEKGFNMRGNFDFLSGKVFVYYDYKTNQSGDFPVRDIQIDITPFDNERLYLDLKCQSINYYYTGSTYDERKMTGLKPEVRFPVSERFRLHSFLFLKKMEKPIWDESIFSKHFFVKGIFKTSEKSSFSADFLVIDNFFTRNLDEYLYFLGEFEKLKKFYPKESSPYYLDPSSTDDWVYAYDELRHFFWGFEFRHQITQKSFFSARYEKREPGIDVATGLVRNTEDIFIAKFSVEF